ncbi:hypothetical protein M8J75_010719 [Diaphorina citri]|nr:hypothetical protein M8J75_010719 [Diaphorina citri]
MRTKHTVIQTRDPLDKWKLSLILTIRNVSDKDLGIYTCESTNSLGKTTANVRVYEITGIELEQYNQAKKKASVINTNVTSSGSGRYLAGIGHTTSSVVSLGLLVWLWFSGAGF